MQLLVTVAGKGSTGGKGGTMQNQDRGPAGSSQLTILVHSEINKSTNQQKMTSITTAA